MKGEKRNSVHGCGCACRALRQARVRPRAWPVRDLYRDRDCIGPVVLAQIIGKIRRSASRPNRDSQHLKYGSISC